MNPFKDWGRFLFGPISARPLGSFPNCLWTIGIAASGLDVGRVRPLVHQCWLTSGHGGQRGRGPAAVLAAPIRG